MVLGQGIRASGVEDRFHDIGATADLLIVARRERTDTDVRQRALNLQ